jgi:hypothetical protein
MIGRWGTIDAPNPIAEALAPFTGNAAQTQAGQGFQALVNAIPGLQAQAHQLLNPGTMLSLVKREARLVGQLATETRADKRLVLDAELKLVRDQIAQLRAAMAPQQQTQIQAVPSSSNGWIVGLGVVGAVIVGGLVLLLGKRR